MEAILADIDKILEEVPVPLLAEKKKTPRFDTHSAKGWFDLMRQDKDFDERGVFLDWASYVDMYVEDACATQPFETVLHGIGTTPEEYNVLMHSYILAGAEKVFEEVHQLDWRHVFIHYTDTYVDGSRGGGSFGAHYRVIRRTVDLLEKFNLGAPPTFVTERLYELAFYACLFKAGNLCRDSNHINRGIEKDELEEWIKIAAGDGSVEDIRKKLGLNEAFEQKFNYHSRLDDAKEWLGRVQKEIQKNQSPVAGLRMAANQLMRCGLHKSSDEAFYWQLGMEMKKEEFEALLLTYLGDSYTLHKWRENN